MPSDYPSTVVRGSFRKIPKGGKSTPDDILGGGGGVYSVLYSIFKG